MTCIVGIVENGIVHLGGDSAGVSGYNMNLRSDNKVFRNRDFVMGFTTSFRMGQLLEHKLIAPERKQNQDIFAYMVTDFVDALRACLKEGGFAEKTNEQEKGGTFLVGYAGRLFTIESDYQVAENLTEYAACGCGDQIALGSLFSTAGMGAVDRLRQALAAAETFSAGVRGPWQFAHTQHEAAA